MRRTERYRGTKDNEVKRNGRQGFAEAHSSDEAGTPNPGDPAERRGGRVMVPREGKTAEPPTLESVSTKLARIAKLAREAPEMSFRSLAHHVDVGFLHEAYRRTRKDGAEGVDGVGAEEYEKNLGENLKSLLDRFKSGTYRAPPVRRVQIPKGDGRTRPIGIPTFEDKILQRAVVMVLNAVYEQDFLDCSFGFRPGRSAHDALEVLWKGLMDMGGGWILDVDIKGFFDTLEPRHLRTFLDQRVQDGVLRRTIDKWLSAGVQEDGSLNYPDTGTPQGGVISPILANVYLHEVLDKWFRGEVKPRLKGHAFLVRYADDFVIVCSLEEDARKILEVLPKRFGKYGLTLHPEKTRLVPFKMPRDDDPGAENGPGSFDLLGFTHFWAESRRGNWVVKRKTADSRLARALKRISEWCQQHRHLSFREQAATLGQKLRGHCNYYGITGNSQALSDFKHQLTQLWHKWLSRRSNTPFPWERMTQLLERFPLPSARAVHSTLRLVASP